MHIHGGVGHIGVGQGHFHDLIGRNCRLHARLSTAAVTANPRIPKVLIIFLNAILIISFSFAG